MLTICIIVNHYYHDYHYHWLQGVAAAAEVLGALVHALLRVVVAGAGDAVAAHPPLHGDRRLRFM